MTAASVALVGMLAAALTAAIVGWMRGWRIEINRQGREQARREMAQAAQRSALEIAAKDLEITRHESRLTRDILAQLDTARQATLDLEDRFARARAMKARK